MFEYVGMDEPVRKRSLLLAGVALAATLPFASVQPASAATVCAHGKVCTWLKRNFEGHRQDRKLTPGCYPVSDGGVRTVSNQSGRKITVYSDDSCYGDKLDLKSGTFTSATPFVGYSIAVWGP
ncbi:peptidase inhibitor family I36 protein [Streptomyces sp. WI03-4A]|uniref:peptidase inhibitor family I36 protein n=1 Tax=Streptomyces sp. WI03-4A TaxID=3028706 RepID=UPI0029B4953B|nr:peptidase inhibitor family I36 protein [Streptomyces sp. WI03-4A]MDX2597124.1 peptidase inhibitor family I36 protein [Streptomyces sp. WI03-4A]